MRHSILPLLLLLIVVEIVHSCEYDAAAAANATSSVQNYVMKYRRGNSQPQEIWEPINIYTEYSKDFNDDTVFGTDTKNGLMRDLSNFVAKAIRRLKATLKVVAMEEVRIPSNACWKPSTMPVEVYSKVNYVFHIRPGTDKMDRQRRKDDAKWVATILHEMVHALLFSRSLYPHFIKRTPIGDISSYELYHKKQATFNVAAHHDETIFEIPGVVKKYTRQNWLTKAGGIAHDVYLLETPKATQEARKHFDCEQLEGVELENQGGTGSAFSHLEKRIFEQEMIGAFRTELNQFSNIILAIFEDSGWYKVDYSQAEDMQYGKGKGCDFVKKSCGEYVQLKKDNSYPFCKSDDTRCSANHDSIERCTGMGFGKNEETPAEYQYFDILSTWDGKTSHENVPLSYADFCPYYSVFTNENKKTKKKGKITKCKIRDDEKPARVSLQIFSDSGRCVEIKENVKVKEGKKKTTTYKINHGCFEHKCANNSLWIKTAKSKFYQCFYDGQLINVDKRISKELGNAKFQLKCPKCANICDNCVERDHKGAGDKPRTKGLIDRILGRGAAGKGLLTSVALLAPLLIF